MRRLVRTLQPGLFRCGGRLGRAWGSLVARWRTTRASWPWVVNGLVILFVASLLATHWEPLGPERGAVRNLAFVLLVTVVLLNLISSSWLRLLLKT